MVTWSRATYAAPYSFRGGLLEQKGRWECLLGFPRIGNPTKKPDLHAGLTTGRFCMVLPSNDPKNLRTNAGCINTFLLPKGAFSGTNSEL